MNIRDIDHIEVYVGNARQAQHFYRTVFGFTPVAYAGLETGLSDRASYMVEQGDSNIVLTEALDPTGTVAEQIQKHGDGVHDIAFAVDNAERAFEEAVERGARPVLEPTLLEDDNGRVKKATIGTFGDTVHSLIERSDYAGPFLPNYQTIQGAIPANATGLNIVDHVAVSLPPGEVDHWVDFYRDVLGFEQMHEEKIVTEYSAMNSKVVEDPTRRIKFVLVEPVPGKRKSQIEEYLRFYSGAGVQHVALHTDNIISTIRSLKANGMGMVSTPPSYYDLLEERVGHISEDVSALRDLNILVDNDEWGYLLQIFTLPLQSRPTYFIEVIQRHEARSFGNGNIKALFLALEREQAKRGTL